MAKKRKKISDINKKSDVNVEIFLKYVFLIIIFLSPLFRGLFFESEFLVVAAILALLGIIYFISIKDAHFDMFDWLFLGLVFSYLLSMTNAASLRSSYLGFIKYVMLFICFYFTRNAFKGEKDRTTIIITVVSSISFISILTILTKAGILNISGAIIADRFSGTFQYANTYASVLAATSVVLLDLALNSKYRQKAKTRSIFLCFAYLNSLALFATGSKGGVLIYGFTLMLFILLSERKFYVLANSCFINVISLACVIIMLKTSNNLLLLLAVLIGFLAVFLVDRILDKLNAKSLAVALSGIIVVTGVMLLFTAGRTPLQRLTDINFSSSSFFTRYIFYKDAFKLFAQNWLIGTGSGGWETLYTKEQTFPYISKLVHSSIIQSMVDVGIIGTIFFVLLCSLAIIKYFRNSFASKYDGKPVFLFFITIFLHSLIDFDLSITVVAVYLFAFLGLVCGSSIPVVYPKYSKHITILLFCVIFLSSTSFALARWVANAAVANASTGGASITRIEKDFGLAMVLDPLNVDYRNYLGQTIISLGINNKNADEIEKGLQKIDEAINLEPNNYLMYFAKGQALENLGRYDEAVSEFERVIIIRPFHDTGYAAAAKAYVLIGQESKNLDGFKKAIRVYDRAKQKICNVPDYITETANLESSIELNLYTGISYMFLEEYQKAEVLLAKAQKYCAGGNPLLEDIKAWRIVCSVQMNKAIKLSANPEKVARIQYILKELKTKTAR